MMPGTSDPELPPRLRKPRLRRWEASEYLKLIHGIQSAPATLAKLATIGGGPRYQKSGRVPLYPITELDEWALKRLGALIQSSSDPNGRKEAA
jgi:hypothetical protein